jgi:CRISPR-associated helicase Cas3/CRISPR-associated endonuclease Cas3-HD
LRGTADRAQRYADSFGAGESGRLCGLLHDLGKYADQFQRRIAKPSTERGRDHSLAGAIVAADCYRDKGVLAALAIEGHHAGLKFLPPTLDDFLKKWKDCQGEAPCPVTEPRLELLFERFKRDGFTLPARVAAAFSPSDSTADKMLDARMLLSALADADFIETEAHFDGTAQDPRRYRQDGPSLDPVRSLKSLDAHLRGLQGGHRSRVGQVRDQLLDECRSAGQRPTGLYTLTAPTGSGKTLVMLAFALHHAQEHKLRRIVLVMPYLNIIDQTAGIYGRLFSPKQGFPPHYVLEDHSLADREPSAGDAARDSEDREVCIRRLLAQNWDAPVILTTHVQCLESLFANHTTPCRKLHRLARSIILFDEVQTLPVELAAATLGVLSRLATRYGSTIVFATATQPAFTSLDAAVKKYSAAGWRPTEIVSDPSRLFDAMAGRVSVHWEHEQAIPLDILAQRVAKQPRVLCIVNLKRHASGLAERLMKDAVVGVYHLSTLMCPAHRKTVLAEVTSQLEGPSCPQVRLVATQCVEAGVDLDFPVVFRALAPLEAIAQAAGRCNRNGSLPRGGEVFVFKPDGEGKGIYPPGYKQAVAATEVFLRNIREGGVDLDSSEIIQNPQRLREYYEMLYGLTGAGDPGAARKSSELHDAITAGDFARVAQIYRLIDQDSINVLVPYDQAVFDDLSRQANTNKPTSAQEIREWMQRAKSFVVTLYRPTNDSSPLWNIIEPIRLGRQNPSQDNWFRCLSHDTYDSRLGLRIPESVSFVV